MAKKVLDVYGVVNPDTLACQISQNYNTWRDLRKQKELEWIELRNYIYATDTRSTSNKTLPWVNSTTTPKLTQIRDNLHANYFAALFPRRKWMKWDADDEKAAAKKKRDIIQAYMENKLRQGKFENEASRLIDDYILYGNVFAMVTYDREYSEVDGETIPQYIGPRVHRISPFDIVFNPVAAEFENTPKIIRSIKTLGEIKKEMPDIFPRIREVRQSIRQSATGTRFDKAEGFVADGFSDIQHYYGSNYVEILTFYGDYYDIDNDELKTNKIIRVVDRAYIVDEKDNPSWLGSAPIFHVGWRERPDNLYAMGPLDNLVGLQYRIDHLENLKADVFDQVAVPMLKIRGEVEDFTHEPGSRIYLGDDGDVNYLSPDTTALNADLQIQLLEQKMEEMAGAPRQAMGIRTPGEKTAFEVSVLRDGANRIFEHKAAHFERVFLEPILNTMLEVSRRNMDVADKIRVLDDSLGVLEFKTITKEDITAKGKIIPIGARHFAERAQRIQDISNFLNIKQADPTIGVHISGKTIAKLMSEELGEPQLYGENITLMEQMQTQKLGQEMQVQMQTEQELAAQAGI